MRTRMRAYRGNLSVTRGTESRVTIGIRDRIRAGFARATTTPRWINGAIERSVGGIERDIRRDRRRIAPRRPLNRGHDPLRGPRGAAVAEKRPFKPSLISSRISGVSPSRPRRSGILLSSSISRERGGRGAAATATRQPPADRAKTNEEELGVPEFEAESRVNVRTYRA